MDKDRPSSGLPANDHIFFNSNREKSPQMNDGMQRMSVNRAQSSRVNPPKLYQGQKEMDLVPSTGETGMSEMNQASARGAANPASASNNDNSAISQAMTNQRFLINNLGVYDTLIQEIEREF